MPGNLALQSPPVFFTLVVMWQFIARIVAAPRFEMIKIQLINNEMLKCSAELAIVREVDMESFCSGGLEFSPLLGMMV